MAINNVPWASGDLVSATKLQQMVQDEVNSTDNIHPQYPRRLTSNPIVAASYIGERNIAPGPTNDFIRLQTLFNTSQDPALLWEPGTLFSPDIDDIWFAVIGVSFYRQNITSIAIGGWFRTVITPAASGNPGNVRFRINVFKRTLNGAFVALAIGATINGSTSEVEYGPYTVSLATALSTDIILVQAEVQIDFSPGGMDDFGGGAWRHIYAQILTT